MQVGKIRISKQKANLETQNGIIHGQKCTQHRVFRVAAREGPLHLHVLALALHLTGDQLSNSRLCALLLFLLLLLLALHLTRNQLSNSRLVRTKYYVVAPSLVKLIIFAKWDSKVEKIFIYT